MPPRSRSFDHAAAEKSRDGQAEAAGTGPVPSPNPRLTAQELSDWLGVFEVRHYTPQQAIDEFNLPVKEYTLRHWAYARKIPHNGMGGRITFTAADIRAISALFAVPAVADRRRG